MKSGKWAVMGLVLAAAVGWQSLPARADVASDKAAAILVFPKILYDASIGQDTVVQISNTSNDLVRLHCFYINANSRCSSSQSVCNLFQGGRTCPQNGEVCLPGWIETDFFVFLTQQQPIAWVASNGLLSSPDVPLDGVRRFGPTGQSNMGTRVPPVPAEPLATSNALHFVGELKCIVVDEEGRGAARNVVKGEATIVRAGTAGQTLDIEKHNAIGIQAIDGDSNGDGILDLGGGSNEYNACPSVLIMDHFFDFAVNPASQPPEAVVSELTLVPCNEDLRNQVPGGGTAQYLIFNEFEQRYSTSTPVQCYFERQLSQIDTRSVRRSIFSVFVAGTLTGQTRIRGVSTGFLGIVRERLGFDFAFAGIPDAASTLGDARTADFNLHFQGTREEGDRIVLP